ncbi:MAG TPA: caspase family protein, partial [Bacteroidia bacterium]|nr:caspase family protein [Bacteroidia bacterium]
MRTIAAVFASILALGLMSALDASERVALVIGNNAYPPILDAQGRAVREAKLENCVRDATAVRDLLRDKLGFAEGNIVFATDQGKVGIFRSLETFQKLAAKADIAVIYYAGHGMESLDGRETFLIPVDADLGGAAESEAVLEATGVGLGGILEKFGRATRGAKVVMLDCCRDRPKGRTLVDGAAVRGGGLALLDEHIPADTLILLAAAPNRQASDGLDHGPFTKALLEVLPVGGRSMFDAFFAVSDRVQETTQKQQVPWLKFDGSGAIFRENFLVGRGVPVAVKAEEPQMSEAEIERRAQERAEKLLAERMKNQPAPVSQTGQTSPTSPMVKTDPAPAPAFPAGRGMEGGRAGEVREFGGIEMVWCPAGAFTMGEDGDAQRVTLTRGFWLAKTETTQG